MISRTSLVAVSIAGLVPFTTAASDVVDVAARQIGKPYVWGAEGPSSFDCSGLTQYAYSEVGLDLPRRAVSQSRIGDPAGGQLQRGDLVFFSTDTRRSEVTHVGIYEGDGVMIDASKRNGRVRRDNLSESYWTDRFMGARRVAFLVADGRESQRRDGPIARPESPSRIDRRKIATAVVQGIAGVLLHRPH
jgi:hypothetical protein